MYQKAIKLDNFKYRKLLKAILLFVCSFVLGSISFLLMINLKILFMRVIGILLGLTVVKTSDVLYSLIRKMHIAKLGYKDKDFYDVITKDVEQIEKGVSAKIHIEKLLNRNASIKSAINVLSNSKISFEQYNGKEIEVEIDNLEEQIEKTERMLDMVTTKKVLKNHFCKIKYLDYLFLIAYTCWPTAFFLSSMVIYRLS